MKTKFNLTRQLLTLQIPRFRHAPPIYTEDIMMSHFSAHAEEYDVIGDVGSCTAVPHCGILPYLLNIWTRTSVRLHQSKVNGQNSDSLCDTLPQLFQSALAFLSMALILI